MGARAQRHARAGGGRGTRSTSIVAKMNGICWELCHNFFARKSPKISKKSSQRFPKKSPPKIQTKNQKVVSGGAVLVHAGLVLSGILPQGLSVVAT